MSRIAPDSIARVREANDIVDVIGHHVQLKRAGTAYKALCPFHNEKSPSFTVSPQRQTFKCFGCGIGGSVIDFIMHFDKLEFIDAIKQLAERASIKLEYEAGGAPSPSAGTETTTDKSALYDAMRWASRKYHATLMQADKASEARAYLESRKLHPDQIGDWQIGFAPDSYDSVLRAAEQQFGNLQPFEDAGLIRRNEHGARYDFFRGRIVFPIYDQVGRVVAFGGRKLSEATPGGKYINSPTTPIYDKSRVLYGIHRLPKSQFNRERTRGDKLVVVVEGYMDVIACHAAGIDCAVAPCGTSITPEQVRTLRRFGDRIVLLMDGDAAGIASMDRIAGEVIAQGANAVAVTIPDGLDPDDFLRERSREEFVALLDRGEDLFAFKMRSIATRHDVQYPAGRKAAAEEALAVVAQTPDAMLRDLLLKRISELFGISETTLRKQLEATPQRGRPADAESASPAPVSRVELGERTLLLRLLTHAALIRPVSEFMYPEDFQSTEAGEVYRAILNCHDEQELAHAHQVMDFIGQESAGARALLTDLLEGDLSASRYRDAPEGFQVESTVEAIRGWFERRKRPGTRDEGQMTPVEAEARLAALRAHKRKSPKTRQS